ncbi:MAG TPA: hypothetical protein VIH06_03350 [Ilumatobacteraceae bacterium]|jgi:hypothetical protein
MKHARSETLDQIEPLLEEIRRLPELKEKSRGVFYKGSKAFLHFHEDPLGVHADLRRLHDFDRYRVETDAERNALLELVRNSATTPPRLSAGAAPEG